eukprot:365927-Chlamydomonas_euryale.AAC.6
MALSCLPGRKDVKASGTQGSEPATASYTCGGRDDTEASGTQHSGQLSRAFPARRARGALTCTISAPSRPPPMPMRQKMGTCATRQRTHARSMGERQRSNLWLHTQSSGCRRRETAALKECSPSGINFHLPKNGH